MKLRIFVIDDEESIRETFKWHLESLGHEVITLPDPSYCSAYFGLCCDKDYACTDLLIVDYSMPRMTGLQLLKLMQKKGCLISTPFKMILTGDATKIDRSVTDRLGCDVRQKPMRLAELEEWVNASAKEISPTRKLVDLSAVKFVQ